MPSQNISKAQLATMDANVKDYIQSKDGDLSLLESNNLSSEIIIINTDLGTFAGELTDLDAEISTEYGKDNSLLLTLTKTDSTHYAFAQNGTAIGTITVPLDNSIESGSLVGTNLSLTLKDGTTEILDVSTLVEDLQISNRNEVNLATSGSTIKDNVVENSNIIDESITEEKLSLGLQGKLEKAETGNNSSTLQELEDLKDSADELKTLHKLDEGESLNFYFSVSDTFELNADDNKPFILTKNKGVIFHTVPNEEAETINDRLELVDLNLTAFEENRYVQATGTYVEGTTYYTDNAGATEVDTNSFVDGETDVSNYYIREKKYDLWFLEQIALGDFSLGDRCCLEDKDGNILYLELQTLNTNNVITNSDNVSYLTFTEVEPSYSTVSKEIDETLVYAMADNELGFGYDGLASAEDIEKLEGLEEIIEQYQALDLKTTDDDFEEYFSELFY